MKRIIAIIAAIALLAIAAVSTAEGYTIGIGPVSYTHLTLPTIPWV